MKNLQLAWQKGTILNFYQMKEQDDHIFAVNKTAVPSFACVQNQD